MDSNPERPSSSDKHLAGLSKLLIPGAGAAPERTDAAHVLRSFARPSNPEALAAVPGLMKQLYGALDEMSFLFGRALHPSGYLAGKIGEIVAAYIYDLELTRNYSDFSEAKSSEGRSVQVRSTTARESKEIVPLMNIGEHLLVVQWWGREIIEVYNGPLQPIWEKAGRARKDGTCSTSMGILRGDNKHKVPTELKIQPKRIWKLNGQQDE